MQKISKKSILRWIGKQAEQLDAETYIAYPKEYGIPPHLRDVRRGKIHPYWYEVPTEYPVNHKRRIYQAYKDEGIAGVTKYFRKRGFNVIDVKK